MCTRVRVCNDNARYTRVYKTQQQRYVISFNLLEADEKSCKNPFRNVDTRAHTLRRDQVYYIILLYYDGF